MPLEIWRALKRSVHTQVLASRLVPLLAVLSRKMRWLAPDRAHEISPRREER